MEKNLKNILMALHCSGSGSGSCTEALKQMPFKTHDKCNKFHKIITAIIAITIIIIKMHQKTKEEKIK